MFRSGNEARWFATRRTAVLESYEYGCGEVDLRGSWGWLQGLLCPD